MNTWDEDNDEALFNGSILSDEEEESEIRLAGSMER